MLALSCSTAPVTTATSTKRPASHGSSRTSSHRLETAEGMPPRARRAQPICETAPMGRMLLPVYPPAPRGQAIRGVPPPVNPSGVRRDGLQRRCSLRVRVWTRQAQQDGAMMSTFLGIATVLAVLVLGIRLGGRQHRLLHLLQLEHYESARLMLWLRRRHELFAPRELVPIAILYAAAIVLAAIGGSGSDW